MALKTPARIEPLVTRSPRVCPPRHERTAHRGIARSSGPLPCTSAPRIVESCGPRVRSPSRAHRASWNRAATKAQLEAATTGATATPGCDKRAQGWPRNPWVCFPSRSPWVCPLMQSSGLLPYAVHRSAAPPTAGFMQRYVKAQMGRKIPVGPSRSKGRRWANQRTYRR